MKYSPYRAVSLLTLMLIYISVIFIHRHKAYLSRSSLFFFSEDHLRQGKSLLFLSCHSTFTPIYSWIISDAWVWCKILFISFQGIRTCCNWTCTYPKVLYLDFLRKLLTSRKLWSLRHMCTILIFQFACSWHRWSPTTLLLSRWID